MVLTIHPTAMGADTIHMVVGGGHLVDLVVTAVIMEGGDSMGPLAVSRQDDHLHRLLHRAFHHDLGADSNRWLTVFSKLK